MTIYHLLRNGEFYALGTLDHLRAKHLSRWSSEAVETLILDAKVSTTSADWTLRQA